MRYWILCIGFLVSIAACKSKQSLPEKETALKESNKPSWVQSRPTSSGYYIGVGVSSKEFAASDYAQVAKRNALNDLASEISVKIDANSILYQLESNDRFREDFKQTTKLSTTQNLEGYEVVDSWEDEKDYWIFYRLSKAKYQEQKDRAIRQSVDRSMGYYKAGKEFERQGDISEALRQYFKALESVSSYLGEPLETQIEGSSVFYGNEINKRIEAVVSKIDAKPLNQKLFSVTGQQINSGELGVRILSNGDPLNGIPVRFVDPSGTFTTQPKQTKTNVNGIAAAQIERAPKVGAYEVHAIISYDGLMDTDNAFLSAYLKTLNDRKVNISLVVESPVILLQATETNLGTPARQSQLARAFEAGAADYRLQTTTVAKEWDYKCKIEASTAKNTVMNDLYISVLSGTLKLSDKKGEVIYQYVFSNVKGVGLNYTQAGDKAIEAAMVKIREEIIPDISRKLTL